MVTVAPSLTVTGLIVERSGAEFTVIEPPSTILGVEVNPSSRITISSRPRIEVPPPTASKTTSITGTEPELVRLGKSLSSIVIASTDPPVITE